MKKHSMLVAFVALTALVAQAQRHHQPVDPAQMVQHRVSFLTEKLGLSPSQQEQATTIFTNEMTAGKALHDQMKTAHESLNTAVQNNDSAAIDQAASTIGSLTSQMISAHAKAEAAFVQTLNPSQQATYSQMHAHTQGGMPGLAGPGGFGPHLFK